MGMLEGAWKRRRERDAKLAAARQKAFVETYSVSEPLFRDAAQAGVDPRTIESIRKQSEKAFAEAKDIRTKSKRPGAVGSFYTQKLKGLESTVGNLVSGLQKQVKTETAMQPELQQLRRSRERAAKQQASLLRRTTGRRALLSSPTGGAGFFGGYFKG